MECCYAQSRGAYLPPSSVTKKKKFMPFTLGCGSRGCPEEDVQGRIYRSQDLQSGNWQWSEIALITVIKLGSIKDIWDHIHKIYFSSEL